MNSTATESEIDDLWKRMEGSLEFHDMFMDVCHFVASILPPEIVILFVLILANLEASTGKMNPTKPRSAGERMPKT